MDKIYVPPLLERLQVEQFTSRGYSPVVDSNRTLWAKDAPKNSIILTKDDDIFQQQKFCSGKVFICIYDIPSINLEAARLFFSQLLGLHVFPKVLLTRRMQRLFDEGMFNPPPPQELLQASERPEHQYKLDDGRIVTVTRGGPNEEKVAENMQRAKDWLNANILVPA